MEKSRTSFARPKRRAQDPISRNDSKQVKRTYSGSEVDVDCEDSVSNYTGTEVGDNNAGFWGFFKNLFGKKKDETTKTIVVSEQVLKNIAAVEQKCDDLGLAFKIDRNTIQVTGETDKVNSLENFIFETEEDMARSVYSQVDENNLVRKDIILSDYLLGMSGAISQKASQLNVHSNIEGNKLVLYGQDKAIVELFGHLMEMQAMSGKQMAYREPRANEREIAMAHSMQENLLDIKKKMDELEIRKDNRGGFYPEENRKTESVNAYLNDIKSKMEALEIRLASGVGQNETAIIQVLNENLVDLRNKVGGLEMKMEVDADGLLQEEMKFQKQMHDSLGAINRKIEAVDHKVNATSGDSMQKDARMKTIQDNIETIAKKIVGLEQKLDNTRTFGVDVDQIVGKVKNFVSDGLTKVGVKEEEVTQKQIGVSVFHRSCRREIEKKAAELKLIIDLGYDMILATGTPKNLESFIVYLQECEMNVKKSLYPKHWDLFEQRKFSLVNVPNRSTEFNEVLTLFNNTYLQYRPILKIERIQNKYLMDHYITHVQKRKELRNDNNLQRRQLFFGGVNPEVIYKNSDVGFDIQYAENKGCGKGLYFYDTPPGNLNYQTAFRTPQGTYKVLIADVLVGRSQNMYKGDPSISKAPEGFDSVNTNNQMGNGKSYVVFNNFHSYPLYVVEYQ